MLYNIQWCHFLEKAHKGVLVKDSEVGKDVSKDQGEPVHDVVVVQTCHHASFQIYGSYNTE